MMANQMVIDKIYTTCRRTYGNGVKAETTTRIYLHAMLTGALSESVIIGYNLRGLESPARGIVFKNGNVFIMVKGCNHRELKLKFIKEKFLNVKLAKFSK